MKLLFAALFTSQAIAAIPTIECTNKVYRDALLKLGPNGIELQDVLAEGHKDAEKLFDDRTGFESSVRSEVKLTAPAKSVECTEPLIKGLFNCEIRGAATLHVSGMTVRDGSVIDSVMRSSGQVNITLKSKVTSGGDGPIPLGAESITIKLNQMEVEANAAFELRDRTLNLRWKSTFLTENCK